MKSVNNFRTNGFDPEDRRKGTKLPPMKKSGKERHNIYSSLEDDDEDEYFSTKRESVFDYFDDEEEDL